MQPDPCGFGQMMSNTSRLDNLLSEDLDLCGGHVITCIEDAAALATEAWGAAMNGEVPDDMQAAQATSAAAVAQYQV